MNQKHQSIYRQLANSKLMDAVAVPMLAKSTACNVANRASKRYQKTFATRTYDGVLQIINVTEYRYKLKVEHTR